MWWKKLTSERYSPQPGGVSYQQICGIARGTQLPWDYFNDPVLLSFWWCLFKWCPLCLEEDPIHSSASNPGWSKAKELWIFWNSGKSQHLSSLVVPEILNMEGEHGSLENGLSYEFRSLLIKALHNLIERSVWKFSPIFCYKMILTNNF
jgi:hypothetical protein